MKKSLFVLIIILLLVIACLPVSFAADDTTPPVMTGISINKTSFSRGETLIVTVEATELESGFDFARCVVSFSCREPGTVVSYDYFTLRLDTLCNGGLQGSFVLDEHMGGTYWLSRVLLTDKNGYYNEYYNPFEDLSFTLVSDYIEPPSPGVPLITNLKLSATTAKVGNTVKYTVTGAHPNGIYSAKITLNDPDSFWNDRYEIICYPVSGKIDTFSGSFTVPPDMLSGLYYAEVCLTAYSGEKTYMYCTGLINSCGENRLRVKNPSATALSPPKITSYSISTRELTAGQSITVTANVNPKYETKIKSMSTLFEYMQTSSQVINPDRINVKLANQGNGKYSCTAIIPPTVRAGQYCLHRFTLWLDNGNGRGIEIDSSKYTKSVEFGNYLTDSVITVKPMLSVSGTENTSVLVGDLFDEMEGVSAANAYTGENINEKITVAGGDIDTSKPGIYLVKYIVNDTVNIDSDDYSVSYTDYRWVGVTEVMPVSSGGPIVITDGTIIVGAKSTEATLVKDGTKIAFASSLTQAGNYEISKSGSAADTNNVANSSEDTAIEPSVSLDASATPLINTSAAAASNSKNAALVIDRTGPAAALQCFVDSETSITIKANASDIAGVEVTKWARGEQNAAYFSSGGTEFNGSFTANGYGKYTVYSRDCLGNEAVSVANVQEIRTVSSVKAAAGFGGNKVSWSAVSGAAGYQISRATSPNGPYTALIETKSNSYTDSAAAEGKTYYYIVRAYKLSGTARVYGAASTTAKAATYVTTPAASISAVGYSSVKLSWKAVPGASGYQVYRSTSVNGKYSLVKTTASKSYKNTGLKTGTKYYYQVRAYKKSGKTKLYGNYSTVMSATPVLSNISKVSASAYNPTAVKISWSKVPGRSGYEIWRSTSPESGFALIKTTSGTTFKNTGLTPSVTGNPKTYYYKVRAYRTVGGTRVYGEFTKLASASPALSGVSSMSASAYSPTAAKISWGKVKGRSGYEIWRSTSADGTYSLIKSTTGTSYKNTLLTPFVTYFYKVRAYVKVGNTRVYSEFSPVKSVKPAFKDVGSIKAARGGASKIKISWGSVPKCSGYEVWRSASEDGVYTLIKSTAARNYTNTGLTTGTTYYYKVRAYVKVNGNKVYSNYSDVVSAAP